MKTVRFDADLERRLEAISRLEGRSQSDIIRAAVDRYCDDIGARRADIAWAPSIGVASLPTSVARDTGKAFTDLLLAKRSPSRTAE